MQEALSDFEPTIGNAKDILVLRALVMHTHLVRPQHHQCELAGCVVHVCPPPLLLTAMSVGDVKVGLTPTARYSASAQSGDNGARAGPDAKIMGDNGATTGRGEPGAACAREGRVTRCDGGRGRTTPGGRSPSGRAPSGSPRNRSPVDAGGARPRAGSRGPRGRARYRHGPGASAWHRAARAR